MTRRNIALVVFVCIILIGGIVYWQYRIHRTPVSDEVIERNVERTHPEVIETDGVKHTVPLDSIISGGPPRDNIPAIYSPQFEAPSVADRYLKDDGYGLHVEIDGEHRFYPYQILVWHGIVNDTFQGRPLLVTYSPLTFSGAVFDREISAGDVYEFGVTGEVWNNNMVMYDRQTNSSWSQVLHSAIVGPEAGTSFTHVPFELIRWDHWRDAHPNGEVLSRETGHERDYTHDPYADYYTSHEIRFPLTTVDDRLGSKTRIFGVQFGDVKKAYPRESIERNVVIEDRIDDVAIMLVYDEDRDSVRGYRRSVEGEVMTFNVQPDGTLEDEQTNSTWLMNGGAVSGPLAGEQLTPIVLEPHYWFGWAAAFPDTTIYQN